MKLKVDVRETSWWFWLVTLAFMIAALAGWTPGYAVVIVLSAVQVVYFLAKYKDPAAYPVQIRVTYFIFTLFGLWPGIVRLVMIGLLLLGTLMVTFFGRCVIALGLKLMPWNKSRPVRLN